jgi:hypothetical protein
MEKNPDPIRPVLQAALFILLFLTGSFTFLSAHVSSPDYRGLFWSVLPLAIIHLIATVSYMLWVPNWTRWLTAAFAIFSLGSYLMFAVRIWL